MTTIYNKVSAVLFCSLFLCTLCVMTSCDDMFEPADENNRSEEAMVEESQYTYGLLMYGYGRLPYQTTTQTDVATDDAVYNLPGNAFRVMATASWTADEDHNPVSQWNACKDGIQYINLFLSKVDNVKFAPSADSKQQMFIDRLKGEAYGLRAVLYYHLLQAHGGYADDGVLYGVPLLTEPEDGSSDFNQPRATFADCVKQCFDDCDQAMALLPADYVDITSNAEIPEKYLINLLATPGIDYVNNTLLTNEVLDVVEEKRQDTFYVATTPDKPWGSSDAIDDMYSAQDVADNLDDTSIDTYYAATYYPWIKFFDEESNKYIFLPPTKDVLRNMADVDNKSYPWYAPAGTERGTVDCTKMHFFAKLEDEDTVYDGRINPLKTFSKEGVIVWGNKTMYTGDTPMDRVNVVRLMLYMKKLIVEACRRLIFEPNDTTLVDEFKDIVNPILAQIKSDRGITDYRLDPSQTPEQMDAHEMSATIWVKPTPTLEYIELNFVVTPQGVSFSDM